MSLKVMGESSAHLNRDAKAVNLFTIKKFTTRFDIEFRAGRLAGPDSG